MLQQHLNLLAARGQGFCRCLASHTHTLGTEQSLRHTHIAFRPSTASTSHVPVWLSAASHYSGNNQEPEPAGQKDPLPLWRYGQEGNHSLRLSLGWTSAPIKSKRLINNLSSPPLWPRCWALLLNSGSKPQSYFSELNWKGRARLSLVSLSFLDK